MQQAQITCPTCRIAHAVPEAGQFPVSYVTEAFVRRLRDAASACPAPKPGKDIEEPTLSPVTGHGQTGPGGLSMAMRSMLQEKEAKILAAIRVCQEVQAQLNQYQTTLMGWGEQQQHLENRLQALVDQSKDARVLVRQEESHVEAKKQQVHRGEQQLHAVLQTLHTVTTPQEACEAIMDTDHRTDEERQKAEDCRAMFPTVHTVTTISKVREASSAALEAATTVQAAGETTRAPAGAAGEPGLPAALDSSITDRLEAVLTPTLQAEDLRSLTQPARNLLQASLVFAVHQHKGRNLHARIILKNGRQYLHALQDQPLPPRAATVQMDEVLPAAAPYLVFLDLAWPGSSPRRVLIRLSPDTPRGRQFLLLCTGQQGPCYANTRLCRVKYKGQLGEYIWGGDYEFNDGSGGSALLPGLDVGEYRKSRRAGVVWGWWGDPALGALFGITTRDRRHGIVRGVFGEVVSGLEFVAAAAHHDPITEVTVADCGVVLWE